MQLVTSHLFHCSSRGWVWLILQLGQWRWWYYYAKDENNQPRNYWTSSSACYGWECYMWVAYCTASP